MQCWHGTRILHAAVFTTNPETSRIVFQRLFQRHEYSVHLTQNLLCLAMVALGRREPYGSLRIKLQILIVKCYSNLLTFITCYLFSVPERLLLHVSLQVRWGDKGATEEGNKLQKAKVRPNACRSERFSRTLSIYSVCISSYRK